jgi:hypothetical protein
VGGGSLLSVGGGSLSVDGGLLWSWMGHFCSPWVLIVGGGGGHHHLWVGHLFVGGAFICGGSLLSREATVSVHDCHPLQYLSVPHRVLQDSQESPGILRNPQESSGILRTPAGLHYDFPDFKF